MNVFQDIMNKIIERQTIADNDDNNDNSNIDNNRIKLEDFYEITLITEEIDENKKEDISKKRKIAYIDGGNAEIIRSADISLQFIRLCGVIIRENKTIKIIKYEYYVLITTNHQKDNEMNNKKDNIYYDVEFHLNENNKNNNDTKNILPRKEHLHYHSFDKTIISGNERGEISKIGEICRKFSEILLARDIALQLEQNDIIILDNSLETYYTNEQLYWNELFEIIKKKEIILAGLTKTTTLLTKRGHSIISVLHAMSKKIDYNCWCYYQKECAKQNTIQMLFVKLHLLSQYIFRIEVYNYLETNLESNLRILLSELVSQSKDAFFPGYPYGLVQADNFARISNKEKEQLHLQFRIINGKNFNLINESTSALNAHGILDRK
ncbi:hypothetical protein HZA96_07205 [Candidatus Woesearchaeota archaeon]|nr:hypothetical protein [Candidatus Woesearchaeota archaeon]